jgi:hypothetical protein
MGRINVGRVILGGVVAAVVIDASEIVGQFLFQAQAEEVMANLGLAPPTPWVIGIFVVVGFVMGISLVWLYAAVRPRYGAGPKTAIMVALFFWLVAYFLPLLGDNLMGIMPTGMMIAGASWGLVELCVASLAGAWIYKEDEAPAAGA